MSQRTADGHGQQKGIIIINYQLSIVNYKKVINPFSLFLFTSRGSGENHVSSDVSPV